VHERQVTTIDGPSGSWRVHHRDSEADLGVLQQIFVEQSYAIGRLERWPGLREYAGVLPSGARPLIIDCGANIGVSSMYFSILYPEARVVALEPERENFELLCENVAPFPRVRPLRKAIASQPGTLSLSDPGAGSWGYRTLPDGEGRILEEVQASSVEEILAEEPDTVPFLLKVDIEGAEDELFSRAGETYARFPLVIIELHDWMLPGRQTSRSFLRWHLSQQRDFVHHGENAFSLDCALIASAGRAAGAHAERAVSTIP
jgi:FkbM family methyltransferase